MLGRIKQLSNNIIPLEHSQAICRRNSRKLGFMFYLIKFICRKLKNVQLKQCRTQRLSEHEIHLGPHRKPRVNCQSIPDGEQIQYFLFSCIYMQINWLFPIFRCQISWARKLISNQEFTPIFHHNGFSVPGVRLLPFKWYGNRRTTTDLRQSTVNVPPGCSVQDWWKRTFRAVSNVSKSPCMFISASIV